jgi:hypothetical protein
LKLNILKPGISKIGNGPEWMGIIYGTGFFFPVVPKGTVRIRVQISAAHSKEDLEFAIQKFKEVKEESGL